MKLSVLLFKFFCVTILYVCVIVSCKKSDDVGGPVNPPPVNPGSSVKADSLSDRLQFLKATKKQGAIPKGPAGSSLKISFKDTLYLVDQVMLPIKFEHLDTTKNVAGVYMQVFVGSAGGPLGANYYYDVPEVAVDSSDTVSVIIVGFDPSSIKLPLTFDVKIIPYDENKQPIAESVRPVKITEHHVDPKGNSGSCGLVLPNSGTWDWVMSYMTKSDFTSTPEKVWGADGQIIQGSCCAGISIYGICPGETKPNAHLHFNTFYQIAGEQITLANNGTFFRRTVERGANPIPDSSNFCLPFEGLTRSYTRETLYFGNYTVGPATVPQDLQLYHDSLALRLQTTIVDPKGGGYGNGGGIIHYLDCRSLVLIQVDPEGFGQHLYKIYKSNVFERWYEF
jgi:hypothetical protein